MTMKGGDHMQFISTYDGSTYTLHDMWKDWKEFRTDDPYNHADSFKTEMFEILMATINGRNDIDIVGMTPNEISNYVIRLRGNLRATEKGA